MRIEDFLGYEYREWEILPIAASNNQRGYGRQPATNWY